MQFTIDFRQGYMRAETTTTHALNGGAEIGEWVYYAYSRLTKLFVRRGRYVTGRSRVVKLIPRLLEFSCPEVYLVELRNTSSLELDVASSSWPEGEEQVQVYRGDMAMLWRKLPWWASIIAAAPPGPVSRSYMKAVIHSAELTLRYSPLEDQNIDGAIAEFRLDPALPNAAPEMEGSVSASQPLVEGDPALIQVVHYPISSLKLTGERLR